MEDIECDILPIARISAGTMLQHVSRREHKNTPLHYGCKGTNRYDARALDYGVIYLGMDLATVLMETIFHKHEWFLYVDRSITYEEVKNRIVRVIDVSEDLKLADLTADSVMSGHFGLNLEMLAGRDYGPTQRVSSEVHAMRAKDSSPLFDGIRYPSRNNYPSSAIALFERAKNKIEPVDDIDLERHIDWPWFLGRYRINVMTDS